MVFSRLLANDSTVGIDIGTSSIKIVHAEPSKEGRLISRVTMCPTPPDSVKEGIVVDTTSVASTIQFAMRSAGIKTSNGTAAIAGPGVMVRHVQLPHMVEQVLRRSIRYEAGKFISASIEDSTVEFEILGAADDPNQMKVMLVAAPTAMVESRVRTLELAGLDPLAIDVEAFSTFRALVEYNPDKSLIDETIAILDIGANHSEINLVSKGSLILTRNVPIAGVSLTNAIKSAENLSEEEAEQRKYGIDLSSLVESPAGTTTEPGMKVVQSLIDELLREIRRSINYFQSQLPDNSAETSVDRIILCGGSSRLGGLVPYTKSRLNIDTYIGNPAMADYISPMPDSGLNTDDLSLFSVAFGLAVKDLQYSNKLKAAA